ncbi:cytidylate kinase [Desulfonema ishimotonii]|uniref:Cytidylate kinase n=1 Tax=Desulfonema ishimotonii TaxID=45657 RepID=A0A401FRD2_9BACT|nr:(d)CMP kinase [Desulfonema ishimotonii]GBC59521.1 cytidylate kinase [Desulfonema ishimotonii]
MKRLLITIDGPAGAGKTTVSKMLAERLAYTYVDTGALYRGIAVAVRDAGISPDDDAGLETLCRAPDIRFVRAENSLRLLLNETDITGRIRTPEITMLASAISAKPVVRECLLHLQRDMGRQKGLVFEGRDMGTVVFPDADIKFFLDAPLEIRATRRYREFQGENRQTLADVERDMRVRDRNDSTRRIAPLKPAKEAVMIDSATLSPREVVMQMLKYIKESLDLF